MLSQQRSADVLLVLTTMIAACGWIFSREAVAGMPVMAFLGIRFLLASAVLLLFCRGAELRQLMHSIKPVLFTGVLQAIYLLMWIYGVAVTKSLGEGAFIMSLSMLFVPLTAWVILKIRPVKSFWSSLPLGIAGLALLTLHHGLTFEASQLLFLASAIIQAVYFCYNSQYTRLIPVRALAGVQLGCTGLVAIVLSGFFESWPHQISTATWGWLLASVFIATSLRFWLQLKGQSMTSASNAALIMLLEPLLTVISAALWYGEKLSLQQWLGGGLILLSLFYYRWRFNR